MTYLIYDQEGRILRSVSCPPDMAELQLQPGERLLLGAANDLTSFVETIKFPGLDPWPVVVERPEMELVVQGATISGLPAGAALTVEHQRFVVEDGMAELEFDFPGTYPVQIECFPYLTITVEITAP